MPKVFMILIKKIDEDTTEEMVRGRCSLSNKTCAQLAAPAGVPHALRIKMQLKIHRAVQQI